MVNKTGRIECDKDYVELVLGSWKRDLTKLTSLLKILKPLLNRLVACLAKLKSLLCVALIVAVQARLIDVKRTPSDMQLLPSFIAHIKIFSLEPFDIVLTLLGLGPNGLFVTL